MDVQGELQQLTRFLPIERLMEKVGPPIEYLPELVTSVLPSIVVSGDGLTLARVLLVTERYLCEVQMTGKQANIEFDFVAKQTIKNYRFHVWTEEIKEGEVVKASYEVAEVLLLHSLGGGFRTELAYAGNERAAWLTRVIEAIPIKLILGTGTGG